MRLIPGRKALSARARRQRRVRAKVNGAPERPRLNVFRSSRHIYAQVIDDSTHHTLASASSIESAVRGQIEPGQSKRAQAAIVGKTVAERAKEQGVETVVFDRAGYQYHGRVQALADAAREAGLKF